MYFFAMNYKDKMKEDPMNEIEGKKKSIKNLTGLLNYENSL